MVRKDAQYSKRPYEKREHIDCTILEADKVTKRKRSPTALLITQPQEQNGQETRGFKS
jgi:hypothetical protein